MDDNSPLPREARGPNGSDAAAPTAGHAWITVILLGLLYIVSFIDRLILALMVEPIKSELDVSDVQVGLLIGSSFAVFYTLASIPLARVADSGNRKWLIVAGAATWGAMTMGSAFAGSFTVLLICRIGVGLGEAALVPAALSLIADLFPRKKRGLPTSIFVMIGACGAAGAMIIGAIVLDWAASAELSMFSLVGDMAPWRLTLILVGAPAILLAAAVAATVSEPERPLPASRETMALHMIARHLFENRVTYAGFFSAATITSVINYSIFAWFPSHLIRVYGMSASSAGMLFGGIGVTATLVGGIVIPWLAVQVGRKGNTDANVRVSMACVGLAAPLLSFSLLTPDLALALLCLAPAILLQLGVAVLFVSTSPLLSPGMYRAQMAALFFLFVNLIGFGVGPPLVAAVAEQFFEGSHGVGSALALLILILVPAQILFMLWSRRAFCRTWQQAADSEASFLRSSRQHAAVDEKLRP
jgi:MFS family permease